jgi:hypothetical protein
MLRNYQRGHHQSLAPVLSAKSARPSLPQSSSDGSHSKKKNPQRVSDFRPINLTHNFSKIISKLLANRLSTELENIISVNQSACIQKRCIHDNFVYVQKVIKDLHKRKIPALFLKLDISKAFDTVN